jgi:hypothetical protein
MKAILHFDLSKEDDREDYKSAMQGANAKRALWEIANEVFRPARKHGYSDQTIQMLVDVNPEGAELISKLEKKFYEILEEHEVDIE